MKKLTCEQVIDNINHYLRANGVGKQIKREDIYQISIIAGIIEAINQAIEECVNDK